MATDDYGIFRPEIYPLATPITDKFQSNINKIEELAQKVVTASLKRQLRDPGVEAPGAQLYGAVLQSWMEKAHRTPTQLIEDQAAYWAQTLRHYIDAQQLLANPPQDATPIPPTDRRFSNPVWETNPWFNFLKAQYLHNSQTLQRGVDDLEIQDPVARKRVTYFTRQLIDMMAPTNFLATNPDALQRAVETEGESLVRGLENLLRDLEVNEGELLVTLADPEAFELGRNIGATPGRVVYRNRILELIQFTPTTDKVHRIPLVIFPPWINKFYILDLKPENSLIKWIVDQGFTLFVVSWKNPDASYADFGMDDYIREGYLQTFDAIKEITGQKKVNAVGYCIAGTTLSMTLSLLKQRGDTSIKSATFFTMLSDFSDQGEFIPFLTDDFVDGIEREVAAKGYLNSRILTRTFSFLRSNDLIYQPAIRSYMMGEQPPAFDLLYWNGDGTNLSARMAVEYLRWLCQQNRFAKGDYPFEGLKLSPKDIKIPICAIACETDHIAAWKSSYNGLRNFASKDKTFVMTQSGHIAGIVNPPSKNKYGHYTSPTKIESLSPDEWLAQAEFTKASWWPRWAEWLRKHSGAQVKARIPGSVAGYPDLGPSPGDYVRRDRQGEKRNAATQNNSTNSDA